MRLFGKNKTASDTGNGSGPRKDRFGGLTLPPMPRLTDPEKPRIDIAVGDLAEGVTPPKKDDDALYKFVVHECWKSARDARWYWEQIWNLCVEYYNDNQHYGIDSVTQTVYNAIADAVASGQNESRFLTVNQIQPRMSAIAAMVTQSAPEALCVPMTNAPIDMQAAAEGRAILAHYNREHDLKGMLREAVDWALTHTTAFCKSTFEPGMLAAVPKFKEVTVKQPDGSTVKFKRINGSTTEPVGDINERIIPGARIYLDPSALKFEDCRWLIHAELYPKSWYIDNFENGEMVAADPGGGVVDYKAGDKATGISSSIGFSMTRVGDTLPKTVNREVATCYEMWILPGIISAFPYGAKIVCAGGRVLVPRKSKQEGKTGEGGKKSASSFTSAWGRAFDADTEDEVSHAKVKKRIPGNYIPYPYDCVTELPFIPLGFRRNPNSPYHLNLVKPLIEPQQDYNRTLMRIRERLEKEKPVLLRPQLDGVGADTFADKGVYSEVKYNMTAGIPHWVTQPEVSATQFKILETLQLAMDDIAGIHDPNFRGEVSSDASGVAINGLKEGDSSRLSEFAANIETFTRKIGEWRLHHAAQFFDTERLMGMDDTGNPAKKPGTINHAKINLPKLPAPADGLGNAAPIPPMAQGAQAGRISSQPSTISPMEGIGNAPISSGEGYSTQARSGGGEATGSVGFDGPNGQGSSVAPTQTANEAGSDDATTLPGVDPDNDGDNDDDPVNNPYSNAVSFQALSEGGQCRVMVVEGSALADTPDAHDQKIMAMYTAQLFGIPGTPAAAKIAVSQLKAVDNSLLLERLTELQDRADAEAAMNAGPPPPSPLDLLQAKTQADMQAYAAKVQADTQAKIALQDADTQQQIALIKAKSMYPVASIAFKGDAAGSVAIEEQMNLPIHETAAHIAGAGAAGGVGGDISSILNGGQKTPTVEQAHAHHDHLMERSAAEHDATIQAGQAQQNAAIASQQSAQQAAMAQPDPNDPNSPANQTPPPNPAEQQAAEQAAADEELRRKKEFASHESKLRVEEAKAMPQAPKGTP